METEVNSEMANSISLKWNQQEIMILLQFKKSFYVINLCFLMSCS